MFYYICLFGFACGYKERQGSKRFVANQRCATCAIQCIVSF